MSACFWETTDLFRGKIAQGIEMVRRQLIYPCSGSPGGGMTLLLPLVLYWFGAHRRSRRLPRISSSWTISSWPGAGEVEDRGRWGILVLEFSSRSFTRGSLTPLVGSVEPGLHDFGSGAIYPEGSSHLLVARPTTQHPSPWRLGSGAEECLLGHLRPSRSRSGHSYFCVWHTLPRSQVDVSFPR